MAEVSVVEHICDGSPPTCGGSYVCDRCGREVGWCIGCDDEIDRMYPNGICDPCWVEVDRG